jgi:predicted dehydrogenase
MTASHAKYRVGIVGCGKISGAYFQGCRNYRILDVVACADLNAELAQATAKECGLAYGGTVEALLADPEIDIIVNLTIPAAHAEVNLAALRAGKHVYVEKPFALDSASARLVLAEAAARNLMVGCAPDTFFGSGLQTARSLIDRGEIGRPIAALAFMTGRGHESWHPNPAFYYQPGGGPLFDMGPYYLTALVNLIGPVSRVSGAAKAMFAERLITSQPRAGEVIPVQVPTHYSTTLEFAQGAIGTMVMSFDTYAYPLPCIVVYGTEGTMEVPNPNHFDGEVKLLRPGERSFTAVPNEYATSRSRGSGVADMAHALRSGRPLRASGSLGAHVLEIMEAAEISAREARHVTIASSCERPMALPSDLAPDTLDD